jgi:hypothetical protein
MYILEIYNKGHAYPYWSRFVNFLLNNKSLATPEFYNYRDKELRKFSASMHYVQDKSPCLMFDSEEEAMIFKLRFS